MALAEAFLAANFNRPGYAMVDHYTYAIVSDGDLEEGISHEAASLAGHLGLGKLIYLYDDNNISIDGPTSLSYSDNVPHALPGLRLARADGRRLRHARHRRGHPRGPGGDRPARRSSSASRTSRYGSPNKQDTAEAHGAPLGAEEVRLTKQALGLPADEHFWVPDEVLARYRARRGRGRRAAGRVA